VVVVNMKKLLFLFIIAPFLSFSQNYNGPESIEYNQLTGSYFIANSNNGQILELDINNNLSVFATNLGSGPHGLEIVNSIIYVCSGGRLKGYETSTGDQVLNYNLNGSFLNGITQMNYAGEINLFITDFSAKKLYKYNIEENSHDEICSFSKNPNGTYYDSINNRLLVVFWGNNAPVYEIDLTNETYSTIINTGLGNLDGISMDQCGNFYVSAWSSNAVHKYNFDFSETELVTSNLSNPADIYYNQYDNILAVPNSGNNTVDFVFYPCDNSSIQEKTSNKNLIKTIDIIGRKTTNKNFKIHIYDDGSADKKYLIN
tara:strand:- start:25 stop:969 length:945 start_codon:yes stop_codon:yes gene_type:complete